MQRAWKKNAAIQFDGLGFAENVDVSAILPDAVFPNGARDERVVIAGNDVNWTSEGAKDFADLRTRRRSTALSSNTSPVSTIISAPLSRAAWTTRFAASNRSSRTRSAMRPTDSAFIPICQSEVWRNFIGWLCPFAKALLHHEADLAGIAALDDLIQISVIRPSPGAGGVGVYPGQEGHRRWHRLSKQILTIAHEP